MSSDAYWTEEKVPQKQTKKTQQTQKNPSPVDAEDAPVPEHLAWANVHHRSLSSRFFAAKVPSMRTHEEIL